VPAKISGCSRFAILSDSWDSSAVQATSTNGIGCVRSSYRDSWGQFCRWSWLLVPGRAGRCANRARASLARRWEEYPSRSARAGVNPLQARSVLKLEGGAAGLAVAYYPSCRFTLERYIR
jgi:hypothetical protein